MDTQGAFDSNRLTFYLMFLSVSLFFLYLISFRLSFSVFFFLSVNPNLSFSLSITMYVSLSVFPYIFFLTVCYLYICDNDILSQADERLSLNVASKEKTTLTLKRRAFIIDACCFKVIGNPVSLYQIKSVISCIILNVLVLNVNKSELV